jgi:hypothetical protein
MLKRKAAYKNLPKFGRPLSEAELAAFKEDLREADKEVQGYFRIYYIIGLIAVAAWIISPETKPLSELVVGNGGYNIYAPLAVSFLNSVSMTYLLYKSVEIHEIAQFMSYASPDDSGFVGWETWRRSTISATRWPRLLYTPFLTLVPLAVSASLLYASCRILNTPINQLTPVQPPSQLSAAQIQNINSVFSTAWIAFYIIAGLHVIPVILIYFNVFSVPRRWSVVWSARKKNMVKN